MITLILPKAENSSENTLEIQNAPKVRKNNVAIIIIVVVVVIIIIIIIITMMMMMMINLI
jgi:flagellar basal body-associated protein FliL